MYEVFGSLCIDELLNESKVTFLYLCVINFGKIWVLDVFQLVDLGELLVKFWEVVYVVLLMIHEVLVRGFFESIDVSFSEEWILELLEKLDFV